MTLVTFPDQLPGGGGVSIYKEEKEKKSKLNSERGVNGVLRTPFVNFVKLGVTGLNLTSETKNDPSHFS